MLGPVFWLTLIAEKILSNSQADRLFPESLRNPSLFQADASVPEATLNRGNFCSFQEALLSFSFLKGVG